MELPVKCCECEDSVDSEITGAYFHRDNKPAEAKDEDGTLYIMFKSSMELKHIP